MAAAIRRTAGGPTVVDCDTTISSSPACAHELAHLRATLPERRRRRRATAEVVAARAGRAPIPSTGGSWIAGGAQAGERLGPDEPGIAPRRRCPPPPRSPQHPTERHLGDGRSAPDRAAASKSIAGAKWRRTRRQAQRRATSAPNVLDPRIQMGTRRPAPGTACTAAPVAVGQNSITSVLVGEVVGSACSVRRKANAAAGPCPGAPQAEIDAPWNTPQRANCSAPSAARGRQHDAPAPIRMRECPPHVPMTRGGRAADPRML